MAQKPTVLAVDDDPTARAFIAATLASLPADVHLASTCAEFFYIAGTIGADLYLIDLDLPDGNGLEIAGAMRRLSSTPIVFLSVHDDEVHRLRALELGAVEYLAKPIHPRELALRVKNLASQLTPAGAAPSESRTGLSRFPIRRIGDLALDVPKRRLSDRAGNDIALTAAEFETLALLTTTPHRVVTRQEIAARLGPRSAAHHNLRIVDILIWRLRRKLRQHSSTDRPIVTVPSQGYTFVADVTREPDAS